MVDQSIAHPVLSAWGAVVDPIPTSNKNESDWLATLDGFRLLVEEKTKLDNPERAAKRREAVLSGAVHGENIPLRPNNRISAIFRKAAKQLGSSCTELKPDARVVWLNSLGFDREAKDCQAFNTLYGATKAFHGDGSVSLQDCYFFYNSDFFRFRELDGAFLVVAEGSAATIKLCLNPFSSRWQSLRDSPFAKMLTKNGLIDPLAQEAAGEALIADTDLDRGNSGPVLAYLRKKYGIPRLFNMDMNMTSAIMGVPHER